MPEQEVEKAATTAGSVTRSEDPNPTADADQDGKSPSWVPWVVGGGIAGALVLFFLPKGAEADAARMATAPVLVTRVEQTTVVDEAEALGTLLANESVTLTSKVTERIRAIHFEEGQRVEEGDLLFELEDREIAAELSEAKAALTDSRRQLERLRAVEGSGAVSTSDLDEEQSRFDAAQARVELFEARLAERKIVAPFDGQLGLREVSPGQLVRVDQALVTLQDLDPLRVEFTVPERYAGIVQPGLSLLGRSAAFREEEFVGRVEAVDPSVDPVTRALRVRGRFDNPDGRLYPGMLLTLQLKLGSRESVIIPESAVIPERDQTFAFVVSETEGAGEEVEHLVEKVRLRLGRRLGDKVEVEEGLEPGQFVVTHGHRARDGAQVNVMEEGEVFAQQNENVEVE